MLSANSCTLPMPFVSHSTAKLPVVNFYWQVSKIWTRYEPNYAQLLIEAQVQSNPSKHAPTTHPLTTVLCACSQLDGMNFL